MHASGAWTDNRNVWRIFGESVLCGRKERAKDQQKSFFATTHLLFLFFSGRHDPVRIALPPPLPPPPGAPGDLLVFDHADIDIVLMVEKKKIVAFPKDLMSEVVYGAESRLMEWMRKNGVIEYDSIQGGNVYGSLEGKIHESKERDSIKSTIYQLSEWIKSEAPSSKMKKGHDDMMQDAQLQPDEENYTELGEVPHAEEKGSILQHNLFAPYLYGRYTY